MGDGTASGAIATQKRERDRGAADPLARHRDGRRLEMLAAGIQPGRVAEAELQVNRRADPHELGDLVVAHGAAEIIRALDIEIDGGVDRLANRGNLRERQVARQID